jgi:hypothetical protein
MLTLLETLNILRPSYSENMNIFKNMVQEYM